MNQRGKAFHHDLEIRYGSKLAMFMYNRPEFISNWYGAINCGATPAFINNNLRKLSNCRHFNPESPVGETKLKLRQNKLSEKTGLFSKGELTLLAE